ncbi:MAG TPA: type II toxin-antitoxin system RelB/DinJ family antitoxin [Verrucomicrobiota bacterium]|nr:type II toxin-antitoxin system RelB/DinJ family antitoxin [Verrucomicrobiota bacterium]
MTKTLQIRLDESLRSEADRVLREIGLDLPSAVRLFLTGVVRTRGIPFELTAARPHVVEIPADAATQAKMDEIGALWRAGKSRRKG